MRQNFLAEASDLNRGWLAELLEDVQATEETSTWLLECLKKIEPNEPYTVDHLSDGVTKFVDTADIKLVPRLVSGFNRLLSLPPVIERRYCEVSEKFQWLITPASKAVERLILAHHPASLETDVHAILLKISAFRGYGSNELTEVKAEFSKLIPQWKELNRALFWFEVQRARKAVDKKRGERLTTYWRASIFESFWRFDESDFEYIAEEISHQTLLDDKLVALSLALNLYKTANRPRAWRIQLKRLVAGNDELSACLSNYLKPPAQDKDFLRWKQQDAKWKRHIGANRRKQEKFHARWKKYLNDNLDKARIALHKKPGTLTNTLLYLFDQTRNNKNKTERWTEYNWKTLIPGFGEKVAHFYRDATVSLWRHHEPKLRSEGTPLNERTYYVIIGLVGLEIEANETIDWPKSLNTAEVERACKYASYELNGFPTWLLKLFETNPKIVGDFLVREALYELSIEKPDTDTHYILSKISWSGEWAWDQIAPSIYEHLKATEPKNLTNLDKLLKVIQGSTLPDDLIEELASRKCHALKKLDHLARWFAVWVGVAPDAAIARLRARIEEIAVPKERTSFAITFITHLWDGRRGDGADVRQEFNTSQYLKSLYLLMHEHIRRNEDIDRIGKGAYSPGLRDDAQEARNKLFELLIKIPGKESFLALKDIALAYPVKEHRPWMMHHAKTRAEQDGDIAPWSPLQVRDFNEKSECTPRNHRELAELAILRLRDLKDDLENGDSSVAGILQTVTQETKIRKYIGRELREKAFGRYSIPQEEEFADAKKPDLRFHGTGFDAPVPVELKLADNWSGPELFERLENQLCGDYLRDNRSRRGIFVLVYRGKKPGWEVPGSNNLVDFSELTVALQYHWQQISSKFPKIDDIMVIGIDLTKRSGT